MSVFLRTSAIFLLLIIIHAFPSFAYYKGENSQDNSQKPTSLVVKFKSDTPVIQNTAKDNTVIFSDNKIMALNKKYNAGRVSLLTSRNTRSQSSEIFRNVYLINFENLSTIDNIIEEYKNIPNVEYVEPDYSVEFYDAPNDSLYQFQ